MKIDALSKIPTSRLLVQQSISDTTMLPSVLYILISEYVISDSAHAVTQLYGEEEKRVLSSITYYRYDLFIVFQAILDAIIYDKEFAFPVAVPTSIKARIKEKYKYNEDDEVEDIKDYLCLKDSYPDALKALEILMSYYNQGDTFPFYLHILYTAFHLNDPKAKNVIKNLLINLSKLVKQELCEISIPNEHVKLLNFHRMDQGKNIRLINREKQQYLASNPHTLERVRLELRMEDWKRLGLNCLDLVEKNDHKQLTCNYIGLFSLSDSKFIGTIEEYQKKKWITKLNVGQTSILENKINQFFKQNLSWGAKFLKKEHSQEFCENFLKKLTSNECSVAELMTMILDEQDTQKVEETLTPFQHLLTNLFEDLRSFLPKPFPIKKPNQMYRGPGL